MNIDYIYYWDVSLLTKIGINVEYSKSVVLALKSPYKTNCGTNSHTHNKHNNIYYEQCIEMAFKNHFRKSINCYPGYDNDNDYIKNQKIIIYKNESDKNIEICDYNELLSY